MTIRTMTKYSDRIICNYIQNKVNLIFEILTIYFNHLPARVNGVVTEESTLPLLKIPLFHHFSATFLQISVEISHQLQFTVFFRALVYCIQQQTVIIFKSFEQFGQYSQSWLLSKCSWGPKPATLNLLCQTIFEIIDTKVWKFYLNIVI